MSDDTTTRKRIPYYGHCPQCGKEMTTAHQCARDCQCSGRVRFCPCDECETIKAKAAAFEDMAPTGRSVLVPVSEYEALVEDRERLEWWFSGVDKLGFFPVYIEGVQTPWTADEWRSAIDKAIGKR